MKKSRRVKAVIFDLDDTLYNQRQHLAAAFLSVGRLMRRLFGLNPLTLKGKLLKFAKVKGSASGKLFNFLLDEYGIKPRKKLLNLMVSAFYSYKPVKLKPYRGVLEVLKELKGKGLKLGLLTDGKPQLQKAKLEALGLKGFFDEILLTDELGKAYRKPNSKGFLEIVKRLGVKPVEAAYVGDNPEKDVVGGKRVGMLTIRVLTGEYRKVNVERALEADITVKNLRELKRVLDDG